MSAVILKYFVALSVHLGANILLCGFLFTAVQSISPPGGGRLGNLPLHTIQSAAFLNGLSASNLKIDLLPVTLFQTQYGIYVEGVYSF